METSAHQSNTRMLEAKSYCSVAKNLWAYEQWEVLYKTFSKYKILSTLLEVKKWEDLISIYIGNVVFKQMLLTDILSTALREHIEYNNNKKKKLPLSGSQCYILIEVLSARN